MNARYLKVVVASILAVYLVAVVGLAHAAPAQRFEHYRSRVSGNVLIVRTGCLAAEDSAAHLRLRDYADNGGRVVLTCDRKGY